MRHLFILLAFFPLFAIGQTFDRNSLYIKSFDFEQKGNKIELIYSLANLEPGDKIDCAIQYKIVDNESSNSNKEKIETVSDFLADEHCLKHTKGSIGVFYIRDVPRNGLTGKVEWDVLKQLEKLDGLVEFRILLVIEESINSEDIDQEIQQKISTITHISPKKMVQIPVYTKNIDENIPITKETSTNAFALIIGNENYKNEISVPYALNDAEIFSKYCNKTLGIPEKQIHLIKDATFGQILGELKWIKDIIDAFDGEAEVIFYYAGHGMPDEKDMSAYLLPVDGNSAIPQTAVKLEDLYVQLTEYPANSITVFLDACFSGGSRNGMLAEGRAVMFKPKPIVVKDNMAVISATQEKQIAYPYNEKQHGLFTYFLLEKLYDSKGEVTLGELSEYIVKNVDRHSLIINGKRQTPNVIFGNEAQQSKKL